MKIKVPTEILVMGKKVSICYKNKLNLDGEYLSGACIADDNLILISLAENQTLESIEKTLAHEIFHFVMAKSGLTNLLGDNEEVFTVCVEENYFPLFKFNRRLWRKKVEVEIGSKD